jgi:hypothetical protein
MVGDIGRVMPGDAASGLDVAYSAGVGRSGRSDVESEREPRSHRTCSLGDNKKFKRVAHKS